MGLGHRWREVEKTYAEVNQLFGDIVKVTPSSKVVGDMALFLLANEIKPADLLKLDEHHDVSLPNSVVEMFSGALGVPPGGWPKKLQRIILRGQAPLKGRPGASLPPVNFDEARSRTREESGPSGAARRPAQLSALSRRVSEVQHIPPGLLRCRRVAHSGISSMA